jgi:hypothetical protein
MYKLSKFLRFKEFLPFFLPILNQLDNIKANATLLDMVSFHEQQNHLKNFIEGKDSTIANLSEEAKEEDSNVNKTSVNNFKHPIKNPPFFISIKIVDMIVHCFLIDCS